MAVIAKPTSKSSSTSSRVLSFVIFSLLLLCGFVFASQERSFVKPSDTRTDTQQLLRHGTPEQRHPVEGENGSKRISFDLAKLKNGAEGTMVFEIVPEWAPLGISHFYELLDADFYTNCRLFRVVPNFVAQFGMSGDPAVQKQWSKRVIKDDPVLQSNQRGTLTYATSGKDSRTTQMFINFGDNKRLDGMGFAPIGRLVEGEEFLDQIEDKYREKPGQGQISKRGNEYLDENFPDLTYIRAVRLLE